MVITDNKRILSATPIYPDYMSPMAESTLINEYKDILKIEDNMAELRMKATRLEQILEKKKKTFSKIKELFDIKYATKVVKEIKETTSLAIINHEDYRNK